MLQVKFATKNIDSNDPDHKLVTDRSEEFASFTRAMDFIRSLRARISPKEVLLGNPEIAEVS